MLCCEVSVMALESKKEGNVLMALASEVKLPKMAEVHQIFDESHYEPEEIPSIVFSELECIRDRIKPGMRVAITCGSRGVANIAIVTRAIVDFVKSCKANPFCFPAMGSHGGATSEGQKNILNGYGITEETMGCPIISSMDTVFIGNLDNGQPVYVSKDAYEADGIILCNRCKAHTAFRAPCESGILKMAVIGMGKQHGAEAVHADGFSKLGEMLPILASKVFENTNILGAIALGENAFDKTCIIKGMTREKIFEEEPRVLAEAMRRQGHIFFDNIDVLVVDKLGKDLSGDGMDPNVTGRFAVPYIKGEISVQHIAVLDLTEETHGNCNGIGLADVTTKRLVDKIDVDQTYPNVWTSTVLCTPKIPMFTHSDRSCIQVALRTCNYIDRENPRVVHIKDTNHLQEIWISEAMIDEANKNEKTIVVSEAEDWAFDSDGNLW